MNVIKQLRNLINMSIDSININQQSKEAHINTAHDKKAIKLSLKDELHKISPSFADACLETTKALLELIPNGDYTQLAKHSPGLLGYDWNAYISCSSLRLAHVANALERFGVPGQRVLDFGSYFGNFSIISNKAGFLTTAVDSYTHYHPALSNEKEMLQRIGVEVLDLSCDTEFCTTHAAQYDFCLLLGVIEHIPHSPKKILELARTVLKPGGFVIIDTPNIAYLYNRERLMRGESIFPQISHQFDCPLPFEGHHREYSLSEVLWMLKRVGFNPVHSELFNYSIFWASEIYGDDVTRFEAMEADPSLREIIFAVGQRPS
ncbi:MAG TPA: class I SAM-dependent methyltransferase [Humidesulfovibrio sp.]|uniref:class I SAM-dependent methyltransferase n=1 Tax=Humidesulfovibrio sp. TaxID=2910988 RepID=UPI002CABA7DD|nr:class I SAM-dependent methyltransferase [Humidesulfovibrio sp.]HWR02665.1 class I SAM-dependent methyltransferase [Humidesulfovibrio sp.]